MGLARCLLPITMNCTVRPLRSEFPSAFYDQRRPTQLDRCRERTGVVCFERELDCSKINKRGNSQGPFFSIVSPFSKQANVLVNGGPTQTIDYGTALAYCIG